MSPTVHTASGDDVASRLAQGSIRSPVVPRGSGCPGCRPEGSAQWPAQAVAVEAPLGASSSR